MARAYSLDLRERVVGLVASGETCRAVAELYDVSVASVVKWSQRARATVARRPSRWAAGDPTCWRASATGYWPGWQKSLI